MATKINPAVQITPLATQTEGDTSTFSTVTPDAPSAPALPVDDLTTDAFLHQQTTVASQQMIGAQDHAMTTEHPAIATTTPFQETPAVELAPKQSFDELFALRDLGEIKFDLMDDGGVKLFSPSFGVNFRHTSQTETMAEDHWFTFPQPSMAVETCRLAQWAKDKGVTEITHRGFFGESGEGIDFGPKPPGMEPAPTVAAKTTKQAPVHLEVADVKVTPQPGPSLAPMPSTPPPTATKAPMPSTPPPVQADTSQANKPQSTIGKVVDKATSFVRKALQLDIAGFKGKDKETGQPFDLNAYRGFLRAPHQQYLQSAQRHMQEKQQELAKDEEKREYQRHIERQMLDQLSAQKIQDTKQELEVIRTQSARQKASQVKQPTLPNTPRFPPKPGDMASKPPSPTGSFRQTFSSLQARLVDQLDETKKP